MQMRRMGASGPSHQHFQFMPSGLTARARRQAQSRRAPDAHWQRGHRWQVAGRNRKFLVWRTTSADWVSCADQPARFPVNRLHGFHGPHTLHSRCAIRIAAQSIWYVHGHACTLAFDGVRHPGSAAVRFTHVPHSNCAAQTQNVRLFGCERKLDKPLRGLV